MSLKPILGKTNSSIITTWLGLSLLYLASSASASLCFVQKFTQFCFRIRTALRRTAPRSRWISACRILQEAKVEPTI